MEILGIKPAVATFKTSLEFAILKAKGEEIQIPRTSLAITAAILSAFPDLNPENTLKNLGDLSPLMVALNERADIGTSAELKIEGGHLTQNQLWALTLLKNQTQKELEKRKDEFLQRHSQDKDVIETVMEDFITLSRLRSEFDVREWPKFLELDSAIFVCAFIRMASPEILRKAGIDLTQPTRTKEEIEEKYKIFITENLAGLNETQKKLRAILAAEMLLKINDDLNDQNDLRIDKLLAIPSFARYADQQNPSNPCKVIKEIKRRYKEKAGTIFPKPVQKLTELIFIATSILKAQRSKNGLHPSDDPTNFWGCFTRESPTTTLRHKLEAMNIISGLFCTTAPK